MKVKVSVFNQQSVVIIDSTIKAVLRKACRQALAFEGYNNDYSVDITIVDNEKIREINREQRNIDKETDVLSFPLSNGGEFDYDNYQNAYLLGDIVISAEKAVKQAELYGHGIIREFAFLTVHSMLHLLGYDHINSKAEEKVMFSKQEEILNKMGLAVK